MSAKRRGNGKSAINDFVTMIHPDRSPAVFRKSRVKELKEMPGGRCLVKYDSGEEFEVLEHIEDVEVKLGWRNIDDAV